MKHSTTLVLALVLGACSPKVRPPTGVVVDIIAQSMIAGATDSLAVRVYGSDGRSSTGGDVLREQRTVPLDGTTLPYTIGIAPLDGDATRLFRVEVDAVDANGAVIATAKAISGFVPHHVLRLVLELEDACRGVTCNEASETCRAAACVDAHVDPSTLGDYAAGADAGSPCPSGYTRVGGSCVDVDECAVDNGGCDTSPMATCTNTAGSRTCACPAGYGVSGIGPNGCLHDDVSLASLSASAGVLAPTFDPAETSYTLALSDAVTAVTIRASVAAPDYATIAIDGTAVASGASTGIALPTSSFASNRVHITVTAESGRSQAYTLAVTRTHYLAGTARGGDNCTCDVAVSGDGNRIAIADWGEGTIAPGIDNPSVALSYQLGAVFLFHRVLGIWDLEATFHPSETLVPQDHFGRSVALSYDGSTLVVGADGRDDTLGTLDVGALWVFRNPGSGWVEQAFVLNPDPDASDHFGNAIDVSNDGNQIAVGVYDEDSAAVGIGGDPTNAAATDSGAVYVYAWNGSNWNDPPTYIKASNTHAGDLFGSSVRFSADGSRLAVGAPNQDDVATDSGAVYVFARPASTWSQIALLKAPNAGAGDAFGGERSIAFDDAGTTLLAGASYEDGSSRGSFDPASVTFDETAVDSGAAYVFYDGGAGFACVRYLKASNADAGDRFGTGVAISGDASRVAIGAIAEDSGNPDDANDESAMSAGAAYLYTRDTNAWSQLAYLKATSPRANGQFGGAIGLSTTGAVLAITTRDRVAIGAPRVDDSRNDVSRTDLPGTAYVF